MSLLAYWPVIGAGFQSDDFRWLWHARVSGWTDVTRMFGETLGFYRPFTQLLWAFDLWRAGPDPTAFSGTNLFLHLLVLVLFAGLARRLLGDAPAAVAATISAAVSHHYNVMAVVWISGRGTLLGAAAALAALWLWDRWCCRRGGVGAWVGACLMTAIALGAYEAVAGLPLLMALMIRFRGRGARSPWGALGPALLWAPYLWIRIAVGARQPWSEGPGYSYEAAAVLPNLLEYTGRAIMISGVLLTAMLLAALTGRALAAVARAAIDGGRRIGRFGALWFLIGLLPALPVGNRSSLYVYFAALGLHLVIGAAFADGARALRSHHLRAARIAAAAVVFLLLFAWPPFAWDRNERLADQARLSMAAIDDIRAIVADPGADECIVLVDDRRLRPNLHQAFSDDLFWLGAFVYGEQPSYRIRYADHAADSGCDRAVRLRLQRAPSGRLHLSPER